MDNLILSRLSTHTLEELKYNLLDRIKELKADPFSNYRFLVKMLKKQISELDEHLDRRNERLPE